MGPGPTARRPRFLQPPTKVNKRAVYPQSALRDEFRDPPDNLRALRIFGCEGARESNPRQSWAVFVGSAPLSKAPLILDEGIGLPVDSQLWKAFCRDYALLKSE